jgi:hypothetical protein
MFSEQRKTASRANGSKSRGPVTPEGKRRSSINAMRHGILADLTLLQGEDRANFEELVRQHVAQFQPANDVEMGFVEEMCNSYWRLRRLWAVETTKFDRVIRRQPEGKTLDAVSTAYTELGPELDRFHRYETRFLRTYQRAMNNLFRFREKNPPPPIEDLPKEPGSTGLPACPVQVERSETPAPLPVERSETPAPPPSPPGQATSIAAPPSSSNPSRSRRPSGKLRTYRREIRRKWAPGRESSSAAPEPAALASS